MCTRFTHSVSVCAATCGMTFASDSDTVVFFAGSMCTFRTSLISEPGDLLKRCPSPASMCAQIVWPSLRLNCVYGRIIPCTK